MTKDLTELSVGVTAFKGRCLSLIDDVARGKTNRLVLMKHNRAVAAIIPIDDSSHELWGAMRGSVTIPAGTDLTLGTGEIWDAET